VQAFRWMVLLPTVGLIVLVLAKSLYSVVDLSLQKVSTFALDKGAFVGISNWLALLDDERFWPVVRHSLVWIFGSVTMITVLGVVVGIFLGRDTALVRFTRAFLLVPWVLPGVVAAATWKWLLQSQTGVINSMLISSGAMEDIIPWLGSPKIAMYVVIAAMTWRLFPLFALVVAAACRSVDASLYEAADMDGATTWQKIRYIQLPAILPQIVTMSLLVTIWAANNLVFVQVMTNGGPFGATEILPTLLFTLAFEANNMGMSATVTLVNATILLLIALAYFRVQRLSEKNR
jgi:multiple sugar transport system permease protein